MVPDLTNKVTNYICMRPSIHICYTILSHFHGVVKLSHLEYEEDQQNTIEAYAK